MAIAWTGYFALPYKNGTSAVLYEQFGDQSQAFIDSIPLAKWINQNVPQSESLFIWANEPQIYFYSQRKISLPYINLYPFAYSYLDIRQLASEVNVASPQWLVTYKPSFSFDPYFASFLQNNPQYKPSAQVGTYLVYQKSN